MERCWLTLAHRGRFKNNPRASAAPCACSRQTQGRGVREAPTGGGSDAELRGDACCSPLARPGAGGSPCVSTSWDLPAHDRRFGIPVALGM